MAWPGIARLFAELGATLSSTAKRTPEDVTGEKEKFRLFEHALSRLSEDKRLVLLMIDAEGLSGDETARILQIPAATVRSRLHYARQQIRSTMNRERQ